MIYRPNKLTGPVADAVRAEAEDILRRNREEFKRCRDQNSCGAGACMGAMEVAQQILDLLDGVEP